MPTSTRIPSSPPPHPAEVKPLAPERYKIQLTVSGEAYAKLRRAQDLLRHVVPNGDPAVILERALGLLVTELERTKASMTERPRAGAFSAKSTSHHIPAAVRRTVWQRDGARCAFTGPHGRCTETGFLEYHHVVPFASGGETSVGNLELRCRAHNQHDAALWFGTRPGLQVRERPPIVGALTRLVPERVRSIGAGLSFQSMRRFNRLSVGLCGQQPEQAWGMKDQHWHRRHR